MHKGMKTAYIKKNWKHDSLDKPIYTPKNMSYFRKNFRLSKQALEKLMAETSGVIFDGQSRNGKSLKQKEKWGLFLFWASSNIANDHEATTFWTAEGTVSKTVHHCIEVILYGANQVQAKQELSSLNTL